MNADRPNVLLIMSDQHNARVMGCAGDPLVETPNLDRLADAGAMLENLYCPSPLCAPSRMSFLTGRMPSENGVLTNKQITNSARPTFAHAAGAAGYRPFLTGKLHALGSDQLLGFVDRAVGDHGSNYPGGVPSVRNVLDRAQGANLDSLRKIGPGRNAYLARDEYAAEAAISHIERCAIQQRSTGEREPFFLSVGLMLPHPPYVALREDFDRYVGRVTLPVVAKADTPADDHPFLRWWRRATGVAGGVREETTLRARAAYWAMVSQVDRTVGSILAALDRNHMAENTLVIYTTDHGDHVGEHGLWWKQTLLDDAARIPGIVSWPGVIPPGRRVASVSSLIDVNATILDAIGAPALPRSRGSSLLSVLTGSDPTWGDVAISEYCVDEGHYSGLEDDAPFEPSYQRMVRSGRYKYIDYGTAPAQLFDLDDDPHETRDRIADRNLAQVATKLATIARDGWDPEQVKADTRIDLQESDIVRAWTRTTRPQDRYRWEMDPRYNTLDEPLAEI